MTEAFGSPFVSLVFAFAQHDGKKIIGDGNCLPWDHLPEDMQNFKKLTMAPRVMSNIATPAIIMGRKTWDSLPRKPLPHRKNIIISRQKNLNPPDGAAVFDDMGAALQACDHQASVIGGAETIDLAYRFANVIFASELLGEHILSRNPQSPCYLTLDYEKDFTEVERVEFLNASIPFIVREYHRHDYNAEPNLKKLLA